MSQPDTFGADPSVRALRQVFAALEAAQAGLLARAGISPLEPGLRAWREQARDLFEAAWPRAAAQGLVSDPEAAARLYLLALGQALAAAGAAPGARPAAGGAGPGPPAGGGPPMIRYRLFGRCRIYHDPVSPVLQAPAQIGWTAWFRDIALVTPRRLKGPELLARTKGWWTVEPSLVQPVVETHGRLVGGRGWRADGGAGEPGAGRRVAGRAAEKFRGAGVPLPLRRSMEPLAMILEQDEDGAWVAPVPGPARLYQPGGQPGGGGGQPGRGRGRLPGVPG